MREMLAPLGSASGVLGVLVCAAAVAGRFYGTEEFLGFHASNVLTLGVALLAAASWLKLEAR